MMAAKKCLSRIHVVVACVLLFLSNTPTTQASSDQQSVTASITLSGTSLAEFTASRQAAFIDSVATTVGVSTSSVSIASTSELAGPSLMVVVVIGVEDGGVIGYGVGPVLVQLPNPASVTVSTAAAQVGKKSTCGYARADCACKILSIESE
eukprot:c10253_g2_i3.p1 GENE.c10253_g2_i3~~c10253_g2_i3.p1  ORF type:complete len:151 (-),score=49.14 c10253_g2_i3:99-551(-)